MLIVGQLNGPIPRSQTLIFSPHFHFPYYYIYIYVCVCMCVFLCIGIIILLKGDGITGLLKSCTINPLFDISSQLYTWWTGSWIISNSVWCEATKAIIDSKLKSHGCCLLVYWLTPTFWRHFLVLSRRRKICFWFKRSPNRIIDILIYSIIIMFDMLSCTKESRLRL